MGQNTTNSTKYFIKNDNKICTTFDDLRKFFSDGLTESGEYNSISGPLNAYCPNGDSGNNKECKTDVDKINAGCLWLFKQFYGDSEKISNNADSNMNIVTYILSWLSYKLNQKPQNGITKLMDFYNKHMETSEEYKKNIENDTEYKTYIALIDKNKGLMDIDISVMSKFYNLFNNLCKMYNELQTANNNAQEYLKYVNNFADEYKNIFNENFNDTNDNLFKQVLSVVSNDYNYIKSTLNVESVRKQIPELTKKKTAKQFSGPSLKKTQISLSSNETQMDGSSSGTSTSNSEPEVSYSETTLSSSLIIKKLILIPFILVATIILLGISYKYSLFGFWKRLQRQYLREKLKKRRK
ncbi:BIR protein [Plasmodium berghei]|uniref:BIR protein n=2 Tax=Plasmodium berghei TaxID=5821 RepID=A0A077TSD1_PLABA|nr:BIR protein [Plasmodium berghei ANKA]CXH21513.1 BIR protein [Plasmodium berghei]CXH97496.1 BIR protein [Plasmodium berghei]SBW38097.1 BIR protein [Plasmodium berghei]SCL82369.1 BIR protein [Plasmodium berghei]SCL82392.1 BIR protein [Plasmodium berghei]|eukprot:XP_034420051.1 BIR protein [Plasmodium berghei ANKA]